ncbi:hypothetical protein D3C84_1277440 [compost metagenome]
MLRHKPVAMLAVVAAIGVACGRCVIVVVVFTDVIGIGRALVVTHTVFARQVVDLR